MGKFISFIYKGQKNYYFCKKNKIITSKNVKPINVNSKLYTNFNYIKNICDEIKKKVKFIEIHNRPEYAIYILKIIQK